MRRVFLTFLILTGSISCVLADDAVKALPPPMVHTLLGAVVRSVSWVDPAEGASQIVVTDASRKQITIIITPTTTLWDADAKAIMQEMVMPKKKVNVIYVVNDEGVNIGKSIKLLK